MGMYAKLFSRITESSLMEEDIPVRYTFVMLLAIADVTGHVIGTPVAVARRLNMPLVEFERCIVELMKPDLNSNSKELDGRRVVDSANERGYRLVNFVTYRDTKTAEERRDYMRDYMRKRRGEAKKVNNSTPQTEESEAKTVNGKLCKTELGDVIQEEVEVESDKEEEEKAEGKKEAPPRQTSPSGGTKKTSKTGIFDQEFVSQNSTASERWAEFIEHRKRLRKPMTERAERLIIARLNQQPERAIEALERCMEKGWQSFEWEWLDKKQEGVRPAKALGISTIPGEHEEILRNIPGWND